MYDFFKLGEFVMYKSTVRPFEVSGNVCLGDSSVPVNWTILKLRTLLKFMHM